MRAYVCVYSRTMDLMNVFPYMEHHGTMVFENGGSPSHHGFTSRGHP